MSTDRDIRLSPQELALKLASRQAVEAAGGQSFVARETGRAQSRISDYCSENTAEFMPLQLVEKIEALGAGASGHPHITRALARARNRPLVGEPGSMPMGIDDLGDWLAIVTRENADLVQALAHQDLARGCEELSARGRERIHREAGELIEVLEQLRRALAGAESGGGVVAMRRADSS